MLDSTFVQDVPRALSTKLCLGKILVHGDSIRTKAMDKLFRRRKAVSRAAAHAYLARALQPVVTHLRLKVNRFHPRACSDEVSTSTSKSPLVLPLMASSMCVRRLLHSHAGSAHAQKIVARRASGTIEDGTD